MVVLVSISSFIGSALTIISGLLVARWLLPEDLGLFNTFNIIVSYIILIQLGIPSGLSRNYSYFMGKLQQGNAFGAAAVSNYWSLALSVILFICSIIVAAYYLFNQQYEWAAGILVVGFSSFQALYISKYLKVLYRANTDFNKLAIINLVVAVFTFGSIIFVKLVGFYGLCIRSVITILVDLALTWKFLPVRIPPKWSNESFKELLKVGMPIYWVANIYSLWPIFQRTIVLYLGGVKYLGLYALALMVENAMKILTNTISSVSFPRMASAWGKENNFKNIIIIPFKTALAGFGINLILLFVGWWALPSFVQKVIPNFIGGIDAARWSLIVGLISIFSVFSNIYMIVQKNMHRMITYIVGFIIWLVTLFILKHYNGFSLVIFPQSMCLAYFGIYTMDIYFFKKYNLKFR